jgi:hypothetical protein
MRHLPLIRFFLYLALGLGAPGQASAQATSLPACPGSYNTSWTNCQGTQANARGDRYVGAFKNGDYDGLGSYTEADGLRYVGEFRQGRRWGRGIMYFPNGDRYAGDFANGHRVGWGSYLFASNRNRYVGQMLQSKFHGFGVFTFSSDGSRYVGEFRDDNYNGRGIYYRGDGTISQAGIWADDKFSSAETLDTARFRFDLSPTISAEATESLAGAALPPCPGVQYQSGWTQCIGNRAFSDGTQYVGAFLNGEHHGLGTGIAATGHRYVGEYRQGKRTGRGTLYFPNGDQYIGDFLAGDRTGYGTYLFSSGKSRYVGQMLTGRFHGTGTYVFDTGRRYVGEFRDDQFSGPGILYAADGSVVSTGVWAGDKLARTEYVDAARFPFALSTTAGRTPTASPPAPAAAPVVTAAAPAPAPALPPCPGTYNAAWNQCIGTYTSNNGGRYVGPFRSGNFNGQGTFYFSNGDVYTGDFVNDVRIGQGNYLFASDRSRYIGAFRDGKFNGVGTYLYADGSRYVGEFRDDRFSGQGVFYRADGTVSSAGAWADSKLVRAEAVDTGRFPFARATAAGAPAPAVAPAPAAAAAPAPAPMAAPSINAETSRLRAEAEQARERQRQAEEALARMQQQVQQTAAQGAIRPTVPVQPLDAHALVIGNSAYSGSARLPNPVNDARAMSERLRGMGFKVTEVIDANRARLVSALSQFNRSAAQADLSLLFYAGHGVQILGTNYMLPIDFDQSDVAQATIQGVSLNSVVEQFMPGKTKLVFLDACRDNPLARSDNRSVTRGLAPINAAQGTLISYATKDGQVAADGVGQRNSPFTKALLEHLSDPEDIAVVLRKVREKVMASTGGKQQPWEYGSLTGGALVLSQVRPR